MLTECKLGAEFGRVKEISRLVETILEASESLGALADRYRLGAPAPRCEDSLKRYTKQPLGGAWRRMPWGCFGEGRAHPILRGAPIVGCQVISRCMYLPNTFS